MLTTQSQDPFSPHLAPLCPLPPPPFLLVVSTLLKYILFHPSRLHCGLVSSLLPLSSVPVTWGFVPFSAWTFEHQDSRPFLTTVMFVSLSFSFLFLKIAFSHLEYNFKILNMQREGNALTRNLLWFMLQMCLTTAKQTAVQEIETTWSNQSQ